MKAKRTAARALSVLIAVITALGMLSASAFASEPALLTLEELRELYGAFSVEAYNIGQGHLVEPSLYEKNGRSVGDITVDVLEGKGIGYSGSTSYFGGFAFDDSAEAQYPEYLLPYYDMGEIWDANYGEVDGMLAEFDYSMYAGWVYTVNEWWASWGASDAYPGQTLHDYNTGEQTILGDVIRWHYTVYGYGADCGYPSNVMAENMGGNLFIQEDRSELIFVLAAINDYYGDLDSDDVYETALAVAADPLSSADEIADATDTLTSYIEQTFFGVASTPLLGDADGDGAVTNSDIAIVIRYLSGFSADIDMSIIDITADGTINNRDALALILITANAG